MKPMKDHHAFIIGKRSQLGSRHVYCSDNDDNLLDDMLYTHTHSPTTCSHHNPPHSPLTLCPFPSSPNSNPPCSTSHPQLPHLYPAFDPLPPILILPLILNNSNHKNGMQRHLVNLVRSTSLISILSC